MNNTIKCTALAAAILPLTAGISKAVVVAQYDFTGHTLTNSAAAVAGATVSSFSIGGGMNLTDNGAPADALRISGDDTDNTTGDAFTNSRVLSFTVTVASGFTMDLNTLTVDYQATNAFGYSSARFFTNIDGHDAVADDTVGALGRIGGGSDAAFVTNTIDFNGGVYTGANISDSDFNNLAAGVYTFNMPWIDDSGSDTRFTDFDNVILDATITAVPEPSSTALLGLGGLALILRRRK